MSVAAALTLAFGSTVSPGQVVDPDYIGTYGVWEVRCPRTSPDQFDRLQCEGTAVVGDILVVARRDNETIVFAMSSSKCPGVVAEVIGPRSLFETKRRNLVSAQQVIAPQLIEPMLTAGLSMKTAECPAFETELRFNRQDTYNAMAQVATPRKHKKQKR